MPVTLEQARIILEKGKYSNISAYDNKSCAFCTNSNLPNSIRLEDYDLCFDCCKIINDIPKNQTSLPLVSEWKLPSIDELVENIQNTNMYSYSEPKTHQMTEYLNVVKPSSAFICKYNQKLNNMVVEHVRDFREIKSDIGQLTKLKQLSVDLFLDF
jgi:hypothetical protein